MNVKNNINWDLIKYSAVISSFIFFNYLLWALNTITFIKMINFFILVIIFIFFFISKKYNHLWYLKIVILLLLLISLGIPTIANDSRQIYLFSGKILFYESNFYNFLDHQNYSINYYLDIVNSRPKLAATLNANLAQLVGNWNEIFPKATNVILMLPPVIFLVSFFKDKIFSVLWIFLMLFFSGKLFINGLMDGLISLYFVSGLLITYNIMNPTPETKKNLLYFILFLFFSILSLCKNEGSIMIFTIIFSSILLNFLYKNKPDYKFLFISFLSMLPIFFWKFAVIINNINFEWVQEGDSLSRLVERITNTTDLSIVIYFLSMNEKLIISIIIFSFFAYKCYEKNKKIITFVLMSSFLYFLSVILAFLISPHDLTVQLEASSIRAFIPVVLAFTYFSIFLMNENNYFKKN